ncbi:Nodulation protein nolO, partial [hydrothermal vent metagenome]
ATDCPVLVNTSFNVRGEPIVCTPEQAYLCFMRTEMDFLVLENLVLLKSEQTPLDDDSDWRDEFELD